MLKPIQDQVIIRELPREEEKIGDLVLPPTANGKEPTRKGIVVASGPGLVTNAGVQVPNETKAGDKVLYSAFTYRMKHEGEELYIVREGSILAIIEP